MSKIQASLLIGLFEKMADEHWAYEWGAAREGCVDCSGAFVYAYRILGGPAIAHGSNSIFRKHVGAAGTEPHPGYAAFTCKPWTEDQAGNAWYGKEPGNIPHIGLVDSTGGVVLNAKGTAYGFCRDKASRYQYFAPLNDVVYDDAQGGGETMPVLYRAKNLTVNDPLSIRAEPDTSGRKVGKIPVGETVDVLDDSNTKWMKIRYGGVEGYASGDYLKRMDADGNADAQDEPAEDMTALVNQDTGDRVTLMGRWRIEVD